DGTDDGGTDPGIQGVLVELLNDSGTVSETTITDAAGNYSFAVDAGSYTVRVSDSNFVPPPAGGAVGDLVWRDDDGNGAQNGGEPGIADVTVNLFQEIGGDDIFIASTVTDENGAYAFTDLPPGTYFTDVADITVPAGLTLISGTDPSASVTIVTTEVFDTLDFGYEYTTAPDTAIVGDLVWLDEDGDGVLDAGERGIGGVTLALIGSDLPLDVFGDPLVLATAQTNDDGYYLFTGVRTDLSTDYQVEVTDDLGVLTGFTLTAGLDSNPNPTAAFPVVSGDVILTKDFGYDTAALASISDVVWFDADRDGVLDGGESGIDGVTVALIGPTGGVMDVATTAGGGLFSFPGLPDGGYSLRITDLDGVLDGLLPTTQASVDGSQAVTLAGADVNGVNFGWIDTGALEGLVGTTLKDPVGDVDQQLDVVPIGDPAGNNLDYDFGYIAPGSLGDLVWFDVDGDGTDNGGLEPGIAGVTVTLTNAASGLMLTTMTDSDGLYSFGGLRPTNSGLVGDVYVVTVDDGTLPAGFTERTFDLDGTGTPDVAVATLDVSGPGVTEDRDDVDFGYNGTGSIGDLVWEDVDGDMDPTGEDGISGVTVEVLDSGGDVIGIDVTDSGGLYSFSGLPPGDYTVRVVPPAGFTQTFDLDLTLDNETTVSLALDENRTDVDFGYQQIAVNGSIGDLLWFDKNGDGVKDPDEPGIPDVAVTLFDAGNVEINDTVTDADGLYLFENVATGIYTVRVDPDTLPGCCSCDGDSDGGADSDADSDSGSDSDSGADSDSGSDSDS
ncbi:MAG: hypothetical protein GY938_27590, partial [Ketobacter sp.]|nr:hypothetical protein [Ketobacter sp.]